MSNPVHVLDVVDGSALANLDRVKFGLQKSIANVAGAGAGAAVTTNVTFNNAELPPSYVVDVDAGQSCLSYVTNKTANGFSVTLVPYPSTATLAAGTFGVTVHG